MSAGTSEVTAEQLVERAGSDTIRFDGAVVPAQAVLEDVNMIDARVKDGTPGAALVKTQTAEAAMMRSAEEHMEMCARSAAGERSYTWAQDAQDRV